MAISTIGTDALASSAVTSAKLASGAPSRSQLPAGTVLQVVYAGTTTDVTTSSNTLVDTGLSASITPTSSTSKILVLAAHNGIAKANNSYMKLVLLRNSNQIANFGDAIGYTGDTSQNRVGGASVNYLDSPATTSSVTYKTQVCSNSNNASVTVQDNVAISTIVLMEIAA